MNAGQILIAVVIAILAVIFVINLIINKGVPGGGRISPLASVALFCVLAGIIFVENRMVGYSLIGLGLILALIDMFQTTRRNKN